MYSANRKQDMKLAKLIGHTLHRINLQRKRTEGSTKGKNIRGRPLLDYMGQLARDIGCPMLNLLQFKKKNRECPPGVEPIDVSNWTGIDCEDDMNQCYNSDNETVCCNNECS
ncbi:Hypothetical protein CINCED_3A006398 [Cinara cedri]|uniref:Uncharacterized protein n=1 Tax=Cinara cedri TaxID=506608 RepID=A0A5E4MTZ7_9HEMI|nr:Hypothetical protein CINCED_3A006398 [Cinara cedri]